MQSVKNSSFFGIRMLSYVALDHLVNCVEWILKG